MLTRILQKWSGKTDSAVLDARKKLRIGIPKILNMWSTHQFWMGYLQALGIESRYITWSSDSSEDQARQFAKGRGTVDCCYPVKCVSGHYGELLALDKRRKIDILLAPMVYSLPSYLKGGVVDSIACPRVMAAPENIKAGFLKEGDAFKERGVIYCSPIASLADPAIVPKQLFDGMKNAIPGLTLEETRQAVDAGYAALLAFNHRARQKSRKVLEHCAKTNSPCLLVVARPYHMDPGIGHEIEVDMQAYGYPVLWAQYLPIDDDILNWMFGPDIRDGYIKNTLDVADVWPSSYSANTNEILWGAKFAARMPWIAGVIRLASYECGMDQPTYTPVQQIVERSGTLFFSFQELDSTKPAGSVKIRVETIAHYLEKYASQIIARKTTASPPDCPLVPAAPANAAIVAPRSAKNLHAPA